MEIEVVRPEGGGFEDRDGRAPVVSGRLARWMIVEAGQAGEISRRDQGPTGDEFEIAGELGPEGGLQIGVLAHRDRAGFRQRRLDVGHRAVELVERPGLRQDRQVVLAIGGAAGAHLIPRLGQLGPQAEGVIIGGAQTAQRQAHPVERLLPVDKGEAFREHHFHGQAQHAVQQSGCGAGRIVLQGDHRPEG